MNGKPFAASQHNIGYLPEERGLYPKKKVSEQLIYLAQLRGLGYSQAKQSLRYWLDRLGIAEYENRLLETLSKGTNKRYSLHRRLCAIPIS